MQFTITNKLHSLIHSFIVELLFSAKAVPGFKCSVPLRGEERRGEERRGEEERRKKAHSFYFLFLHYLKSRGQPGNVNGNPERGAAAFWVAPPHIEPESESEQDKNYHLFPRLVRSSLIG